MKTYLCDACHRSGDNPQIRLRGYRRPGDLEMARERHFCCTACFLAWLAEGMVRKNPDKKILLDQILAELAASRPPSDVSPTAPGPCSPSPVSCPPAPVSSLPVPENSAAKAAPTSTTQAPETPEDVLRRLANFRRAAA